MRVKRIILICVMFIFICNVALAKYIYEFSETIAILTRDASPLYSTVSYSTQEWTNECVTVKISCNKEVEQLSGFEISENRKNLIKEVSQNTSEKIKIRDLSGNDFEVEYNVNNIDKEIPQIIGCEDGGVYSSPVVLEYFDNQGIKNINVDRYNEELQFILKKDGNYIKAIVEEHPLNTKKYKYYINEDLYSTTSEEEYTYAGLEKETQYKVRIQALDGEGNILDEKEKEVENIYLLENFIKNSEENTTNLLYKSGNYQIRVIDFAGNEIVYKIKVK